jgi:hypothetical protein
VTNWSEYNEALRQRGSLTVCAVSAGTNGSCEIVA